MRLELRCFKYFVGWNQSNYLRVLLSNMLSRMKWNIHFYCCFILIYYKTIYKLFRFNWLGYLIYLAVWKIYFIRFWTLYGFFDFLLPLYLDLVVFISIYSLSNKSNKLHKGFFQLSYYVCFYTEDVKINKSIPC